MTDVVFVELGCHLKVAKYREVWRTNVVRAVVQLCVLRVARAE